MDQNQEKRGYLLEDFRLFHLSDRPVALIEYHYHEFHKILLLFSGTGGYFLEGTHYPLSSGDVVLVGSQALHRPMFSSPYERVILYISPEFLSRVSTPEQDLQTLFSPEAAPVFSLDRHDMETLQKKTLALEQELSSGDYLSGIAARGLLLELLVFLARCRRGSSSPAPTVPGDPRIRNIMAYIGTHLSEDMTIDALAEQFYISKYHMMRLFRKETGMSIHGYILDQRLHLAKALMAENRSATDACYEAGFHSYCAFTRAYKTRFGCSPTGRRRSTGHAEETYE